MRRPLIATLGLGLVLTLLTNADSDAQGFRNWNRKILPRIQQALPIPPRGNPVQAIPRIPNYFLDQRAPALRRSPLGSNDLLSLLQSRGFSNIGPVQQRGATFITDANGPGGERVRIVVNGNTGAIDGVRVIPEGGVAR